MQAALIFTYLAISFLGVYQVDCNYTLLSVDIDRDRVFNVTLKNDTWMTFRMRLRREIKVYPYRLYHYIRDKFLDSYHFYWFEVDGCPLHFYMYYNDNPSVVDVDIIKGFTTNTSETHFSVTIYLGKNLTELRTEKYNQSSGILQLSRIVPIHLERYKQFCLFPRKKQFFVTTRLVSAIDPNVFIRPYEFVKPALHTPELYSIEILDAESVVEWVGATGSTFYGGQPAPFPSVDGNFTSLEYLFDGNRTYKVALKNNAYLKLRIKIPPAGDPCYAPRHKFPGRVSVYEVAINGCILQGVFEEYFLNKSVTAAELGIKHITYTIKLGTLETSQDYYIYALSTYLSCSTPRKRVLHITPIVPEFSPTTLRRCVYNRSLYLLEVGYAESVVELVDGVPFTTTTAKPSTAKKNQAPNSKTLLSRSLLMVAVAAIIVSVGIIAVTVIFFMRWKKRSKYGRKFQSRNN